MFPFQVENLKENMQYQFQVRAVNMAGLSKASVPNVAVECKEYTITVPGGVPFMLPKPRTYPTFVHYMITSDIIQPFPVQKCKCCYSYQ